MTPEIYIAFVLENYLSLREQHNAGEEIHLSVANVEFDFMDLSKVVKELPEQIRVAVFRRYVIQHRGNRRDAERGLKMITKTLTQERAVTNA